MSKPTANHHLQGMVLKPRANTIDPRIAKTGELKRSKGDDGKLYMMLDKKDWNRYHVLSDQEVEEEHRRSIEIEKAVIKSTGRIRPHSASSPNRYRSHNSSHNSPTASSVSPLRPRPHSANDSSHNNQPQMQYSRSASNTMGGMSPNHHPQHQQGMGIAMAENDHPNYNYTHPQQSQYHRHSADNLSHTNAVSTSKPIRDNTHSYDPPAQYRHTSPVNQDQGRNRQKEQTQHQQQQHQQQQQQYDELYDNNHNHNNTTSSSPVVLTMGALRAKYEQNLDVIEQLYREKRVLEDRVRSLDYQVHNKHQVH